MTYHPPDPSHGRSPPPPYQQQIPMVAVPPTSGLATASMVFGILGLVIGWCMFGLPSLVAVIIGHLALRETKTGAKGGHGQAIAGLILGYLIIIPSIIIFFYMVTFLISAGGS